MRDQQDKVSLHRPVVSRMRLNSLKFLVLKPMGALSAFRGVIAAVALMGCGYLAATTIGLPAFHFSYDYRQGTGADPYKTVCRYLSFDGVYERRADQGRCPWVVLVLDGAR